MLMEKTMSVQSEIKVLVAVAMLLAPWPCLRLAFALWQMAVKRQCSLLKILWAVLNIPRVVKGVGNILLIYIYLFIYLFIYLGRIGSSVIWSITKDILLHVSKICLGLFIDNPIDFETNFKDSVVSGWLSTNWLNNFKTSQIKVGNLCRMIKRQEYSVLVIMMYEIKGLIDYLHIT